MDTIHLRKLRDFSPPYDSIAVDLFEQWNPEVLEHLNFWVEGKGYALSWREHADGHTLSFRRNWGDHESLDCDKELVLCELAVVSEQDGLKLHDARGTLYTGHANGWTYFGPLKDKYHTQDELDAWRALRDRQGE